MFIQNFRFLNIKDKKKSISIKHYDEIKNARNPDKLSVQLLYTLDDFYSLFSLQLI